MLGCSVFTATYPLGSLVYLRTDAKARIQIVTRVSFSLSGGTCYTTSYNSEDSDHLEYELLPVTQEQKEALERAQSLYTPDT